MASNLLQNGFKFTSKWLQNDIFSLWNGVKMTLKMDFELLQSTFCNEIVIARLLGRLECVRKSWAYDEFFSWSLTNREKKNAPSPAQKPDQDADLRQIFSRSNSRNSIVKMALNWPKYGWNCSKFNSKVFKKMTFKSS